MGSKARILIVDDQPHFMAASQAALVARGFEVVTARNRVEAEEIAGTQSLSLVVLGTIMPQGDAFLFHQWFRRTPRFSDVPLIVLDAAPEQRFIKGWCTQEGLMLEAEDYLCKPVEPAALMLRIERLLHQTGRRISVLVADDHAMVRDGIRALLDLQEDIQVVGEAVNGRDALEKARQLTPDVVLMDIVMPVMDGLEATRHLSVDFPRTKVLMLSQYDDEENVLASSEAGAFSFIPKRNASTQLLGGIRSAASAA